MVMKAIRVTLLLLVAASALAGCMPGPTASEAELQEKVIEAEARAKAAEQRAKNAEALAELHRQEPQPLPAAAPPEVAQAGTEFGEPVNDTAPIEPAPAMPADNQQP